MEGHEILVLDGALATQLEQEDELKETGALNNPLWSATILLRNPSLIRKVHLDYYLAGADVAITASYQAATDGLQTHAGLDLEKAMLVVKRSVELAKEARDEAEQKSASTVAYGATDAQGARRRLLVAGSIGPYGAFLADGSEYTGIYPTFTSSTPNAFKHEMKRFHRPRMQALLDAGADLLAIETQPCFAEIEALAEMLREEFTDSRAWVSCTVRNQQIDNDEADEDQDETVVLSDGTSLRELCELLNATEQVIAIGVNCCPKNLVTPALRELSKWTDKPLVAYPNSGEIWDAVNKVWGGKEEDEKSWEEYVDEWTNLGARFIGGCCRTGPEEVRVIRRACDDSKH